MASHSTKVIDFKDLPQSGSVGCTTTGKTAELTVGQMSVTAALHEERQTKKVPAKQAGFSRTSLSVKQRWKNTAMMFLQSFPAGASPLLPDPNTWSRL